MAVLATGDDGGFDGVHAGIPRVVLCLGLAQGAEMLWLNEGVVNGGYECL